MRFLVEAADSNGSASVFECHVPANSRMPCPTAMTDSRRRSTGIEGTTTWTIDGETVNFGPGAECVRRGRYRGVRTTATSTYA